MCDMLGKVPCTTREVLLFSLMGKKLSLGFALAKENNELAEKEVNFGRRSVLILF